MKIRTGFVSNSSSSSFVVVGDSKTYDKLDAQIEYGVLNTGGEYGNDEFGWQEETYNDIGSRLNLCMLLARNHTNDPDAYNDRILAAVKQIYPEVEYLIFESDGYADHQSADDMFGEIFASDESLFNFIFCTDSYITTDNDNH